MSIAAPVAEDAEHEDAENMAERLASSTAAPVVEDAENVAERLASSTAAPVVEDAGNVAERLASSTADHEAAQTQHWAWGGRSSEAGTAETGADAAGSGADHAVGVGASGASAQERAELGALLELCSLPHAGPARLRALLGSRSATEALADLHSGRAATLAALGACRGVDAALVASWRRHATAALGRAASGDLVGGHLLEAHERAGIWLWMPGREPTAELWANDRAPRTHAPSRRAEVGGLAELWASERAPRPHAPSGRAEVGGLAELWASDPEPPMLLFGQGAPVDPARRRVGIVGTRRCSAYGRHVAQMLGAGLAAAGVTVVSGLATGIDGIAQRAALDAGGPVIGVVASGLDHVYPPANRNLWADVARSGTLLSEYPLGTRANRWRFPARNRIVAALSEVLIVVESGPSGGSMYTVDAAAERGRPVMAVPGPITSTASEGTNRLLAEGCAPVVDADDVLVALGTAPAQLAAGQRSHPSRPRSAGKAGRPGRAKQAAASGTTSASGTASGTGTAAEAATGAALPVSLPASLPPPPADELDRRILDELTARAATVDELALRTEASLGELVSSLGRLRLSGWVVETGGWWERSR